MNHDTLFHIDETLDDAQRKQLNEQLLQEFGSSAQPHESNKPHLFFFPCDPLKAPPHEVIQHIKQHGYHAQVVDL